MVRRDNRGISLVEIMIVITIMAIVGSVGLMGLNAMSGRPAQQTAQKLIYSLERHRVTAMGKVDASYILRVEASGKIVCEERVKNEGAESVTIVDVGTKRVKLSYELADGTILDMAPGSTLLFQFDRGSGAFKTMGTAGGNITRLIVKSGGREVKVRLVKLTGKVYLD